MGKRGPAPRGEYIGQTAVLSTRVTPELRARLEEEVSKRQNNTISREVERRLRASFIEDDAIASAFGSRTNYALMRTISMVLELWHNPADLGADWTEDPTAYEQVCRKIEAVLRAMRPSGKAKELSEIEQVLADGSARSHPDQVLARIKNADLAIPIDGPRSRQVLSRVKGDLGPLIDRANIFRGTAEQMRSEADRLEAQIPEKTPTTRLPK